MSLLSHLHPNYLQESCWNTKSLDLFWFHMVPLHAEIFTPNLAHTWCRKRQGRRRLSQSPRCKKEAVFSDTHLGQLSAAVSCVSIWPSSSAISCSMDHGIGIAVCLTSTRNCYLLLLKILTYPWLHYSWTGEILHICGFHT